MRHRRITLGVFILLLALTGATQALEPDKVYLRGETLAVSSFDAPDPQAIARTGRPGETRIWILHFTATLGARNRQAVEDAGAEILGYLPVNAYLVRATPAVAGRLAGLSRADLCLPYEPRWKIAPELAGASRSGELLMLNLSFAPGVDLEALGRVLVGLGAELAGKSATPHASRIGVNVSPRALDEISALPELVWIAERPELVERNDDIKWAVQSGIPDSIPIWDQGLHGEGQIVGHIDSSFEPDLCWFEDPEGDPVGPDHRKLVFIGDNTPVSNPRHGTHTAGTVTGNQFPITGGTEKRGLAYESRIAHNNYGAVTGAYDLYTDLVLHHDVGARVHTNSWGYDGSTAYTNLCEDIDAFCWDYEESMVAFAVTNSSTLKTPENAKNVLAVGSTKSGFDYKEFHSGGAGPTFDGRRKPEIYSPGQAINSADYSEYCDQTSISGTSMACPGTAAGGALARQYYEEGWYPSGAPVPEDAFLPSGALMRATLLNATLEMEDPDYPSYPDDRLGWGRLVLDEGLHFADELRKLWLVDVFNAQGLETGQSAVYPIAVGDGETSLKITLVFTDYPGEMNTGFPVVNNLDLIVESPSGDIYHGNEFHTGEGQSQTGGDPDELNSVERVLRHQPEPGLWTLTVSATAVPMGPQGFALVVAGDLADSDQVPPMLEMSFDAPANDSERLELRIEASEPLDPESLELWVGGETQWPGSLDEDGLVWTGHYVVTGDNESLDISACAEDLAGNETCLEAVVATAILQTDTGGDLASVDGGFGLSIAADALPLDETEWVFTVHPVSVISGVGGPRQNPVLASYCVSPAIAFNDNSSTARISYTGIDLPGDSAPENLYLALAGDSLGSFISYEDQSVFAFVEDSGCFDLMLSSGGGSTPYDPRYLRLAQSFPNPIHPAVGSNLNLRFELRAAQRVWLVVYDVAGREIAELLKGDQRQPGIHTSTWNGKTKENEPAASGIYFARLRSEQGRTEIAKFTLLR